MATYKQGILGGFSGRIGNVIGTYWKGQNVMRIRAASYNDANTPAQQEHRLKFKLVQNFLLTNKSLIDQGFNAVDNRMTALNAALKANIKKVITGVFPNLSVDKSKVILSTGNLAVLEDAKGSSTNPAVLFIDWVNNPDVINQHDTDILNLSVTNESTQEVMTLQNVATRSMESVEVLLPTTWSGKIVQVLGFMTADSMVSSSNEVSNTMYLGQVTLA